jgi:hypothetical protein
MQIYGDKLSNEDRPVARRWTFGALGLYGTILVLMILYAELGPKPDASLASGEATSKLSIANGIPKMASETDRR